VNPAPDPNSWFHARIVVAFPKATVFVGDAMPSLAVDLLSDRKARRGGLWSETTPAAISRT
jgi:hypothetical protein